MFPLNIRHLLFSLSPPVYPLFPSEMPDTEPKFYLFTNIQFCSTWKMLFGQDAVFYQAVFMK